MFKKKIVIIGGSISGCAIAILLENADYDITILERSSGHLKQGNGTGVSLPFSLIQQCINYNLLDENIPFLKAKSRTFSRKDTLHNSVNFWKQDLQVATLNWNHIYESLRSRVDLEKYHSNSEVKFIKKTNNNI